MGTLRLPVAALKKLRSKVLLSAGDSVPIIPANWPSWYIILASLIKPTECIAAFQASAECALSHPGFRSVKVRALEAATPASREKAELCISKAGEATHALAG